MNPFDAIGDFFSGIFGQKKKVQNRPQPQTPQQPNRGYPLNVPGVQQSPGIQMPNQIKPPTNTFDPASLNLGGVKMQAPAQPTPVPTTPQPTQPAQPPQTPGQKLDAALAAPKQNTGTTNPGSFLGSAVRGIGKGLSDTANFAVNTGAQLTDAGLGKNGIGGIFGQDWSPHAVDKTKGVVNALQGVSDYLDQRQINKVGADPVNNALYAGSQFLDPAVIAGGLGKALPKAGELFRTARPAEVGAGVNPVVPGIPVQRSEEEMAALKSAQEATTEAQQSIHTNPADAPEVKPPVVGVPEKPRAVSIDTPRATGEGITPAVTHTPPPAITSPNRPISTVQAPSATAIPDTAGVRPPVIEAPQLPVGAAKAAPTPDEATAAAQQAVNDAATQAPKAPAAAEAAPIETPITTESRQLAATQPPPPAPVAEAAAAREAAGKAPTDAIANEVVQRVNPATGEKTFYRIPADQRDAIVNSIDNARDGTATAGRNIDGQVTHVTARTPEDMLSRGFTDGGTYGADAPTPTGKLGTITHNSVLDGSINTPEGVDSTVTSVTSAAHKEAKAAGSTLEDIIKKGQTVWEKNPQATTKEASDIVKGFTPEQQQVFKDYSQEIATLRDRSGHSLTGGNQGPWYGPRQFLQDGESGAYDSRLVNELKRTGSKTDSEGNALDYSAVPYEHAIRRYADAVDAGSQRIVDAAETNPLTGESTGIKIPDSTKQKLEESLKEITGKRDEQRKLLAEGDKASADKLHKEVQKDIGKAFQDFMDNIPGAGSDRRAAINNVKAIRGNYEQTLAQTLTLSNIVNRVADQGTKVVETAKQPLVRGLEKKLSAKYEKMAMPGADSAALNTTKEARKAARQFAEGTMAREIGDNFRATVSNAGAGRNPIAKGIAKVDAFIRGGGAAGVQAGDLSTSNVREALQIGASRPEAAGLKTVADYKKYFGEYTQTQKFQDDLNKVSSIQNPKIGLAGGEVQGNKGTISNTLSKNVDNFVSTQADKIRPGLGNNRAVREANDLVKGNVTGYSGVGSRVFGTFRDALVPNRTLKRAAQEAASGDPVAAARATKIAAHAVADSIALYGTAGAAAALAKSGVIGYTGGQPVRGSSESAYNKANNIPANQWYINAGGNRIYFDPARPTGAAGIAADVAGSLVKGGGDVASAVSNIGGQVFNQAGGSSLPDTISNIKTGYLDSGAPEADKKYARQQTEAVLAPATGILNNVANVMDNVRRAPTNFLDDLRSNIPVLRAKTPVAKDSMGNEIPNSKQASGGSSLFSIGKNTDSPKVAAADPLSSEITRLQKIDGSVMPTNANTNATDPANKEFGKMLLSDPIYTSADDKGKAALLHDVLIGKSTKDINSKLGSGDKQALLDHKILGNKADAWLDDNGNAVNYYTADYNNAKANGTLTAKQDSLENKGGPRYKMVRAQVDQQYGADGDLKQLYDNTSASEWKDMTDPKSDNYDPETAGKLLAYDDARTKAGVSGKSSASDKNKYVLKTNKGSGRQGVAAADKFAFASLPGSLVGNSDGSKGYASDAPTFQPIADLKAPAIAQIPNGRTISVNKVIQI